MPSMTSLATQLGVANSGTALHGNTGTASTLDYAIPLITNSLAKLDRSNNFTEEAAFQKGVNIKGQLSLGLNDDSGFAGNISLADGNGNTVNVGSSDVDTWNAVSDKVNKTISASGAITSANITVSGSLTTSKDITGGTSFFVDETNKQVSVGKKSTVTYTPLFVSSQQAGSKVIMFDTYNGTPIFTGRRYNGTPSSAAAVSNGNVIASFLGAGYNGSDTTSEKGGMSVIASQDWAGVNNGVELALYTTPNNSNARTERMRIDNTGNVGIGTSTPTAKLDINGNISSTGTNSNTFSGDLIINGSGSATTLLELKKNSWLGTFIHNVNTGQGEAPSMYLASSRGSLTYPSASLNGDMAGQYVLQSHDGTNWRNSAIIKANTTQDWNSSQRGSKLQFLINPSNSTTLTETMRLDSDMSANFAGNIMMNSPGYSSVQFYSGSTSIGTVFGNAMRGIQLSTTADTSGSMGWNEYRFNNANRKIQFGHDGTNSWIQPSTSTLKIGFFGAGTPYGLPHTSVPEVVAINSGGMTVSGSNTQYGYKPNSFLTSMIWNQDTGAETTTRAQVQLQAGNTSADWVKGFVGVYKQYPGMRVWLDSNHHMIFGTNNTERMRITNTGIISGSGAISFGSVTSSGMQVNGTSNVQNIIPQWTDTYDVGSSQKLVRSIYASKLHSLIFAKDEVMVHGGHSLLTKNCGTLPGSIDDAQTIIDFGIPDLAFDSIILFRTEAGSEYMGITGQQDTTIYEVTRDLANSGALSLPAGTPFAVLGVIGDGRIEMRAGTDDTRISVIQQGSSYNDQVEKVRIGDLTGLTFNGSGSLGYGIWTDNGYFKGGINADYGNIGGFSIHADRLSGGLISGSTITGGTVSGSALIGGTVSGTSISGGTVSGSMITGGTIAGSLIQGGIVSGSLVQGASIKGASITGADFATDNGTWAAGIQYVRLNSGTITMADGNNSSHTLTTERKVYGYANADTVLKLSNGLDVANRIDASSVHSDFYGNWYGNAIPVSKIDNTGSGAGQFLRGDGTWSDTVSGLLKSSGVQSTGNISATGSVSATANMSASGIISAGGNITSAGSKVSRWLGAHDSGESGQYNIPSLQDGDMYYETTPWGDGIYGNGEKGLKLYVNSTIGWINIAST